MTTPEEALRAELAAAPYLREHYADGDVGAAGFLAGAAYFRLKAAGAKPPPLPELKALAARALGSPAE